MLDKLTWPLSWQKKMTIQKYSFHRGQRQINTRDTFIFVLPRQVSPWTEPLQTTLCHLWKCSTDNSYAKEGREEEEEEEEVKKLRMSNWQFDSLYSLLHRESQKLNLWMDIQNLLLCTQPDTLFGILIVQCLESGEAAKTSRAISQHNTSIWGKKNYELAKDSEEAWVFRHWWSSIW